jgi:predicted MFS family arabinose efflux permease
MIFLVDFVARGLGQGPQAGAAYWVLFGLGALAGPIVSGHLADRIGFGAALRVAFVIEAVAVALPVLDPSQTWLVFSSVVVGAFVPGIVALVLGRVHELLAHHPAEHKTAWGVATTSFAILQAVRPTACHTCSCRAAVGIACCSRLAPPPCCWRSLST